MKFAFTADLHLSRYGQDPINEDSGLPDRLHGIMNTLRYMANYCVENRISTMVIGGDIMHNKSIIYSLAQKLFLDFLNEFKGKLKFWVVTGNHDLSHKGTDSVSALSFLDHHDAVEINATHGIHGSISDLNYDGEKSILIVPYSHDMIDVIKKAKSDILISHFGLNEGVVNSGLSIVADIGLKDLRNNYKLVLVGHYHKPQEIVEENFSLYYSGSLIQLDWGEKNDIKRFLVIDTETLKVESIPTQGYRQHIEIEINKGNVQEAIKEAEKYKANGHHVKLLKTENVKTNEIDNSFIIVDKTDKDITNRGLSTSMTDDEILKRYLSISEIDEKEHDEYIKFVKNLEGEENERHSIQAS